YLLANSVNTTVSSTGLYDWQLDIHVTFDSSPAVDRSVSGTAAVVRRDSTLVGPGYQTASPYGPGWSLAGVDQLVAFSDGVLYVYGAGGSRFFSSAGGGSFTSPDNSFGCLVQNGDNTYTYTAKDQTRVEFDSSGLQTQRVETHNLALTYTYSSGLLSTI